jgi:hypothetical protein
VKVALRGPLEDAVRLVSRALALPGGKVPGVEVRDGGDAQVSLDLPVALPAWTLLEMMAVQTGTMFAMEGDVLVFAKAEEERGEAEDQDGLELPGGSLQGLALLLTGKPLRGGDPEAVNARLATRGTAPIGGGPLQVGRVGESVTVSGPVRTLRALEIGLRGMRERALVVSVEVSIFRVGKETPLPEGGPGWVAGGGESEDASGLQVQGTLGAAEYGKAMEKLELAGEPGVTLAGPGMVVRLFQTAMMMVEGRRVAMMAVPMGQDRVALHVGMDGGEPGGPEMPAYGVVVELGSGMGGLLRREVDDGVECVGMVPKLKDASWEEPVFELPRGIVAEKPGMVYSPYAPEAGFVDVEGVKSGTKVRCPYSGLNFVVP